MAAKAGMLSAGYSAVHDAVEKGRIKALLFATDLSDGTREKIMASEAAPKRQAAFLTKDEIGALLNRELVGILGITDNGFANAIFNETDRLKNLISASK
jgi:ribosomal protein L7Ae-like RNA K-turn-binding protein